MIEFIRRNLRAFIADEKAVSALEYAILVVVVLAAIVTAINSANISDLFDRMASVLSDANAI